jgi:hypothetical protein
MFKKKEMDIKGENKKKKECRRSSCIGKFRRWIFLKRVTGKLWLSEKDVTFVRVTFFSVKMDGSQMSDADLSAKLAGHPHAGYLLLV